MRLTKAIRNECLMAKAHCADKADALRQAAELAKNCHDLDAIPFERILEGFNDREALCSTGIGEGIALPHCRIPNVNDFVVGLFTLDKPIDFDAIDGKKVSIIAFIVGPDSNTADHARILSGLSLRLSTKQGRQELLAAKTAEELSGALELPGVPKTPEEDTPNDKRLVHMIVQDEDIFHRVLQAVESIEGTTAIVLESNNAGKYLTRLPVFASLMADTPNQFSRVILATVLKSFTNELLRRIEAVTGPLGDRRDVAVIVQDVFLMAGIVDV